MRIVWKDSTVERVSTMYRGYSIEGYSTGWISGIPGDNNIYKTKRCAKNAINEILGYDNKYGYEIIGTKEDKKLG